MRDKSKPAPRPVTGLRRDNPVNCPPAVIIPFVPSSNADVRVTSHKVGKSGAVHLSKLPKGVNVHVVQIDEQTYVVSSRSESEVRDLASLLPKTQASPFASVSLALRGQKHESGTPAVRPRGPYTGPLEIEPISDAQAMAGADLSRTTRRR